MPITTDGKEPDLGQLSREVLRALERAATRCKRAARRASPQSRPRSQKDVIIEALPDAIRQASGDGASRYSLRQLFYAVRPRFLTSFGEEPDYGYFSRVVGDYEDEQGHDLPGIYRDTRGVLYHPHTREEIPLGTLSVEQYRRPPWTFNKILYSEKEGFFPLMKDARWPERHDCALLTSKGFASRAARDVLDLLGTTDEPLTFFCIHDADGPGTLIVEDLKKGTRRRAGVEIVNLGLEHEEAVSMGLPVEPVEREGGKAVAVAEYASAETREWLQTHRVELNAMSTPRFLQWLDDKMASYDGKLVPPRQVLTERLEEEVQARLREEITARVLREAGVDDRVGSAYEALSSSVRARAAALTKEVRATLETRPEEPWGTPIAEAAAELALAF